MIVIKESLFQDEGVGIVGEVVDNIKIVIFFIAAASTIITVPIATLKIKAFITFMVTIVAIYQKLSIFSF